jgi:hypothetical protein
MRIALRPFVTMSISYKPEWCRRRGLSPLMYRLCLHSPFRVCSLSATISLGEPPTCTTPSKHVSSYPGALWHGRKVVEYSMRSVVSCARWPLSVERLNQCSPPGKSRQQEAEEEAQGKISRRKLISERSGRYRNSEVVQYLYDLSYLMASSPLTPFLRSLWQYTAEITPQESSLLGGLSMSLPAAEHCQNRQSGNSP